jgi:DNA polymerase III alpha subunit
MTLKGGYHLILLAKDNSGYRNLSRSIMGKMLINEIFVVN